MGTTSQQSLDAIATLLARFPGVSSVLGFVSESGDEGFHFRCTDFESLKEIGRAAGNANVSISLGNPDQRLCYEKPDASGFPFYVEIEHDESDESTTTTEIFGIFIERRLKALGLIKDGPFE